MSIRVLLAEDQAVVRAGLAMLLGAQDDIEIVGEAGDGAEAIALTKTLAPDVVVMDLRMPGVDGVAATQAITRDRDRTDHLTKVLVLTTFNSEDLVYAALRAGASGFLLKEAAPSDLAAAVRRVSAGDAWIDPGVGTAVIRALNDTTRVGSTASAAIRRLTEREAEVLVLMAEGLSNDEITDRLVLSIATVKTHIGRVLMKTGARDRAQAVALAYQSGLVRPPSTG